MSAATVRLPAIPAVGERHRPLGLQRAVSIFGRAGRRLPPCAAASHRRPCGSVAAQHMTVREALVRALGIPEPRGGAARALLEELRRASAAGESVHYCWAIGNALGITATAAERDELEEFALDDGLARRASRSWRPVATARLAPHRDCGRAGDGGSQAGALRTEGDRASRGSGLRPRGAGPVSGVPGCQPGAGRRSLPRRSRVQETSP
jgi:hypothetical protein